MAVPLLCLWNHFVLVLSQFVRQAILAGNLRLCSIDQMTVGAAAVTPPTSHGATWMAHQRQVQHFHIFFGVVQTFNTFRMLLKWLHFRRPVLWWPVCVTRWLSNPRWLVCNPLPIDNHDKVWQSGLAKWFPICWGLSSFLQSGFRNFNFANWEPYRDSFVFGCGVSLTIFGFFGWCPDKMDWFSVLLIVSDCWRLDFLFFSCIFCSLRFATKH